MNLPKRIQRYIIESQTYSFKNGPNYLKILAFLYKLLGRKFLAKLFVTSDSCTGCKQCLKMCPNQAIDFRLHNPRRNNKCKGCLLCVYLCPNQAIILPMSTLIVGFLFLFLPYDEYIKELFSLQFSSISIFLDTLLSLFLWSIGYIVFVFIFGKISFLFSVLPVVKKARRNQYVSQIFQKIHPINVFPVILPKENSDSNMRKI